MRFLKRLTDSKQCEIPFCDKAASHNVKLGAEIHCFCEKHFRDANTTLEEKRKYLKPELMRGEDADKGSKDAKVKEKIEKWFVTHDFGPHVRKISSAETDFTFFVTLGSGEDRTILVCKPKDKADQIVFSLSSLWKFDSERMASEFLNLKNGKGNQLWQKSRKQLRR